MSSTDVDPLDRFSAGLALAGSLIPAPGAAAAFMMSAATWTDQEDRALSDPSGLWAIGVGVFLVLGVGFLIRADQVREPPRHPWQRLPGLDQGFIKPTRSEPEYRLGSGRSLAESYGP